MPRILVVDDQEPYREYLSKHLLGEGHEVETAGTASEALSLGRQFEPEMLVTDWMLGDDRSGVEIYRQLQRDFPALRVILISGYPFEEMAKEVEDAAIENVLCKPFSLQDLSRMIREGGPR